VVRLAKVDDLDYETFQEKHILWLHIQVDDLIDVQKPEPLCDLTHNVNDFSQRQCLPTMLN
jgi:hypothetical protein